MQRAGGDVDALGRYAPSFVPSRMAEVGIREAVILESLGLPLPAAPMDTAGAVTLAGPASKCTVVDEPFFGFSGGGSALTDAFGVYDLANRQLGTLYVDPSGSCVDLLTGLPLPFPLSSFSVPAPELAVNPVAMLAQGFYTHAATEQVIARDAAGWCLLAAGRRFMV